MSDEQGDGESLLDVFMKGFERGAKAKRELHQRAFLTRRAKDLALACFYFMTGFIDGQVSFEELGVERPADLRAYVGGIFGEAMADEAKGIEAGHARRTLAASLRRLADVLDTEEPKPVVSKPASPATAPPTPNSPALFN